MPTTFDGDNLIITLESGITQLDIKEDLYEPWKEWQLNGVDNTGYPPAFRVVGGDPLTDTLNAGSYFFLQNQDGWRIRPAEEDASILISGNLAAEDPTLPLSAATLGGYTVLLVGLQPVSQTVGLDEFQATLDTIDTTTQATNVVVNTNNKLLLNKTITDPVAGTITVYDDDDTTVLFVANIFEDAAGTTPYQGTGVERRERLA